MDAFWQGFLKQAKLRESTKLEPHQIRVQERLKKSPGLLLYHGLGSGKSLSGIAASQGEKTDVVVPASLRGNFQKEVQKHTTGYKPNIMSYDKAVKTPATGDTLIVDEAHMLGTPGSMRSQELLRKAPEYKKRILLTGTPIRNHPYEIAPLLRMVRGDNAVPIDPKAFNEQYIREQQISPGFLAKLFHGAKNGVEYKIKNPEKFSSLVHGYVDYHAPAKENFPAVTHETVDVPMSSEQMKYYDFVMDKAGPALRYKIERGLPPSKAEASNLNTFLSGARQVANSTKSFGGTETSPKIQQAVTSLKELHEKDQNFRGLVYSNYLDAGVRDYADQLKSSGISHAIFDGSLSDPKRKAMIHDYNTGKIKVLLISGAGSQGLDLKGTKLIQLLEPHWNSARLEQAEGRGIRYKSHDHLPEDERHVLVQRFHSTIPRS
ncbi:MAG: DEAD/DEAH box helicase, partial [Dehalococcoidia bacterium]|nr:DEAD/DEAH box helicase [Dehalococcoidia bacterium]